MPAFFGDGYGAVLPMLTPAFYTHDTFGRLLTIFAALIILKLLATCVTLGSGGSGGIIAPSLFLGAVTGATLGLVLRKMGLSQLDPHAYALVGLGAVLAAVVHAPMAAILILFEVTRDYQVTLPAMLACIIATATARVMFKDSIYTLGLRRRGVRLGASGDLRLLQRLLVEQVTLEPAVVVHAADPFQQVLDLMTQTGAADFIVVNGKGTYEGMVTAGGIRDALIDREAVPLLLVAEVLRADIPVVRPTDDLAAVLDTFAMHDVARLPVALSSGKIIGLISRASLMRRYQQMMVES
jgi:CIC family chloride channel protein